MLAWFMVGIFLAIGFYVPIGLVRKGIFHLTGVYMSTGGGAIVLCAIAIFVKIVYY